MRCGFVSVILAESADLLAEKNENKTKTGRKKESVPWIGN
jgi:hypothetical protein